MSNDRTSYAVAVSFLITADSTGRRRRLLVGHHHDREAAVAHGRRCRRELERIPWLAGIDVAVETVWHLQSGRAAGQLVHDIFASQRSTVDA